MLPSSSTPLHWDSAKFTSFFVSHFFIFHLLSQEAKHIDSVSLDSLIGLAIRLDDLLWKTSALNFKLRSQDFTYQVETMQQSCTEHKRRWQKALHLLWWAKAPGTPLLHLTRLKFGAWETNQLTSQPLNVPIKHSENVYVLAALIGTGATVN